MTANNFDKHTLVWRNDPTAPQEEFVLLFDDVGTQGAAYGGTNVLRTVTTFYPVSVGASLRDARSGFVASIRHEDGRLDIYDYFLVSNLWIRTVTHLHGGYRVRLDYHSKLPQVRQAKLGRTNSGRSYIVKKSTYD